MGTPAIDLKAMPQSVQDRFASLSAVLKAKAVGVGFSGRKPYDCPKYDVTQDDSVIQNGNSFIVLGYDRPHGRNSGYGGKGETRCSAMDIVVGRLGYQAKGHNGSNENLVSPNFKKDACRIYISQKAAVDDVTYFDLPAGTVGNVEIDSPRSTIALKADTLRFIARENIKFITRTDSKNSQGGKCGTAWQGQYGIDLIAMADDSDMQSMVKGQNLVACLKDIIAMVNKLRDRFITYVDYQGSMNQQIMSHTHYSPFFGITTSPSVSVMVEGVQNILNTCMNVEIPAMTEDILDGKLGSAAIEFKYLSGAGPMLGKRHILSKYNNTN